MKLYKILFVLILLVSFQIGYGQKPKAEPFDEFGILGCDDLIARVDNFYSVLKDEPTSTGYAIIYAEKGSREAKGFETFILGQIHFTRADDRRIIVKHAEEENGFRVILWKVLAGANLPSFVEHKAFYVLPTSTKAFRFAIDVHDICPTLSPKLYADYLLANPNMRGHIVIFETSIKKARNVGENWLKILTKDYGVPRSRLKVFYRKSESYSENVIMESATEFWLVPRKKK